MAARDRRVFTVVLLKKEHENLGTARFSGELINLMSKRVSHDELSLAATKELLREQLAGLGGFIRCAARCKMLLLAARLCVPLLICLLACPATQLRPTSLSHRSQQLPAASGQPSWCRLSQCMHSLLWLYALRSCCWLLPPRLLHTSPRETPLPC